VECLLFPRVSYFLKNESIIIEDDLKNEIIVIIRMKRGIVFQKIKMVPREEKYTRKDLTKNLLLENIYSTGMIKKNIKLKSATNPMEGRNLYDLIYDNQLSKTLEIGLAMGVSAVWICQAHKDLNIGGTHIAIDPFQSKKYPELGWSNLGKNLVKRAGLSHYLKIIQEKSYLALPKLLEKKEKFDLIYIDGWHTFDYTLLDFFFSDKLLKINGIIVIDDILHPGVRKCLNYIKNNYSHFVLINNSMNTQATLVKIREDSRNWNFHVNF